MNIEALAQETSGSTTWQVGSKVIVSTTSPGWTYDVGGKLWLFNGKKTTSSPPETSTVTIKCCREKGTETSCPYEGC
ncbi:hypothetical protein [uncultured Bacteroides sp.]|uniref:hypothetical protein n=1 Tax=uncultured Bacteroides sp. TaxID=162156 RepID=UPI002AAB282A|nr:hypothetical protein [uncultured Bacteroides sp.]